WSDCTTSKLLVLVKLPMRRSLSPLVIPSRPLAKSTKVFAMLATGVMGTSQGVMHEGDGTGMCSTVTPEAKGMTCHAMLTKPTLPARSQRMLVLLTNTQRTLDDSGVASLVVAWKSRIALFISGSAGVIVQLACEFWKVSAMVQVPVWMGSITL